MKPFLQKHRNYLFFLVVLLLLISLKILNPSFIKSVSYLSFDLYQKVFAEKKDSEVVIIDIDENSLGKFGQFPWNRLVFAKILDQLNKSNPKAIGFDIFFTEKDRQSPEAIIKSYNLIPSDIASIEKLKSPDDVFSEKLKENNSIIAVLGSNVPSHSNYDRKAKARFLSKGGDPKLFTYSYPYSIGSLEKLESNVKGLGSISFLDQSDGIIRSLPLVVQFNKKIYPTMGLEMVRVGSKQKNIYVELNEVGIERISARPYKIQSDPNGIIWIKYKKSDKKQYISAQDVYDGKFQSDFFKDKYVLIGASAQGLFDLVKIPLGVTVPGVEVHANVIENILDQSYLIRNPNTYIFELLFSIIVAFVTYILSQKIKPKYSLSIFFGNILTIIIIGFSIYKFRSELVDISYPIFMVVFLGVMLLVMMLGIIPKFSEVYATLGASLPLATRKMIDFSTWLQNNAGFMFFVGFIIFSVIWLISKTQRGGFVIDSLKLKVPVFGSLLEQSILNKFCKTFGILIGAGVPVLESTALLKKVVDNKVYEKAIEDASDYIRDGYNISTALRRTEVFPSILLQLASTGEDTGELDSLLDRAADYYHKQVDALVERMTTLIEPLLILMVGAILALMVVLTYLPVFHMGAALQSGL